MLLNHAISLRRAGPSDWPAVEALLQASELPTEGAQAHLGNYLLATRDGEVVGCAGAEVYASGAGTLALVRSVAVAPGLQRQGIGRLLVERLLQEARARDIAALYLLTVTAPEYFAQYGFRHMKARDVPEALKASAEFQGACPACATLMVLTNVCSLTGTTEGAATARCGPGPAAADAAVQPSRCCG
ncbi:MAG: GNAT family N-acetyltransferase [Rubrivivax sp.]|nr:MAG: GNAT family N-acetyltransferase [Rubrivivax sp.]